MAKDAEGGGAAATATEHDDQMEEDVSEVNSTKGEVTREQDRGDDHTERR